MKIITSQELQREWIPSDASPHLQPAWMDIFNSAWSARVALNDKEEVIWLWPYLEKTRYGMKKYGRLAFCPDNGPLFLNQDDRNDFDPQINRWFSMVVIDDRSGRLTPGGMVKNGWNQEERFYQYIDLERYPKDFQAVTRSKRKRMKKNSHLEFFRLDNPVEVGELLLSFFHPHGFPHFNHANLKRRKEMLEESFDSLLFGINNWEGQVLAVQWLIGFGDTLYGWIVVRHPDHHEIEARELLLWNIIQWARDHYRTYDLGGSTIPGVRRFNLEMGAQEIKYPRFQKYYPSAIRRWRRGLGV